jgi:hypothetical protein
MTLVYTFHIWVGIVLEPCDLSQTLQQLDMQSKFFEQTHFTLDFLSLLMSSHEFPSPNGALLLVANMSMKPT